MNLPSQPLRRTRLLGFALLIAVFVVGSLVGFSFNHVLEAREPARARSCAARAEKHHASILSQLDMAPEQQAQVDRILERRRGQIDAFWEGEGTRLRAIVDSTRAEIRTVLTPAQRAEYDRLRAEHRARRKAQKAER